MLHRPNLSPASTPSNCQDLLFDDVLSVERAGQERRQIPRYCAIRNVEVFLTNLLAETLDAGSQTCCCKHQVSDYRPVLPCQRRSLLRRICRTANWPASSGWPDPSEMPHSGVNMVVGMHAPTDFIIEPLPNHLSPK